MIIWKYGTMILHRDLKERNMDTSERLNIKKEIEKQITNILKINFSFRYIMHACLTF